MTSPPRGPTLSDDILWQIFMLNTDLGDNGPERALNVARHTSQVCRVWRATMLNAPSLWGRIITISPRIREDWKKEVLRRSGSSLLWIRGDYLSLSAPTPTSFFFGLLKNQWARIQRFHVCVGLDLSEAEDWYALLAPAPNLEVFRLYSHDPDLLAIHNPLALFANHAPRLQHFESDSIRMDLPAAWFSNILHLELDSDLGYTTLQLLDTLQSAPLLERLFIAFGHVLPSPHPLPHVDLPHLKFVRVQHQRGDCLEHLNQWTPAEGCSIRIQVYFTTGDSPETIRQPLRRHLERYLFHLPATTIEISCCSQTLHVAAGYRDDRPSTPLFDFRVVLEGSGRLPFQVLQSPVFSKVTGLALKIDGCIKGDEQEILRFLSYFTSVAELKLCRHTFTPYLQLEYMHGGILFPGMRRLEIEEPASEVMEQSSILCKIFRKHAANGVPVTHLLIDNTSWLYGSRRPTSMAKIPLPSCFIRLSGLRIVWSLPNGDTLTYVNQLSPIPRWKVSRR